MKSLVMLLGLVGACVVPDSDSHVDVSVSSNAGVVTLIMPAAGTVTSRVVTVTRWIAVPIPVTIPIPLRAATAEAAP